MVSVPALSKIGLFGGTFDPIHIGHLIVAEWVWDALALDTVFFIPNNIHPFQKRQSISAGDLRLKMLELAIRSFPQFQISPYELQRKEVSYTIDTLRYFRKQYPNAQLNVIIGADNLADFDKWKEPQAILQEAQLVVYNRKGAAKKIDAPNIVYLETPHIEISSTQIRERLRNGRSCQALLPADVYRFIVDNGLYLIWPQSAPRIPRKNKL